MTNVLNVYCLNNCLINKSYEKQPANVNYKSIESHWIKLHVRAELAPGISPRQTKKVDFRYRLNFLKL